VFVSAADIEQLGSGPLEEKLAQFLSSKLNRTERIKKIERSIDEQNNVTGYFVYQE
jgi:hypothetical protein